LNHFSDLADPRADKVIYPLTLLRCQAELRHLSILPCSVRKSSIRCGSFSRFATAYLRTINSATFSPPSLTGTVTDVIAIDGRVLRRSPAFRHGVTRRHDLGNQHIQKGFFLAGARM
jgi:hypothetical protein